MVDTSKDLFYDDKEEILVECIKELEKETVLYSADIGAGSHVYTHQAQLHQYHTLRH